MLNFTAVQVAEPGFLGRAFLYLNKIWCVLLFYFFAHAPITQLIRRITHNHIKFHLKQFLEVFGMNKSVGVTFQFIATGVISLGCVAVATLPDQIIKIFLDRFYLDAIMLARMNKSKRIENELRS